LLGLGFDSVNVVRLFHFMKHDYSPSKRFVTKFSRLIFLRSRNEWAEGNNMEPELKYGRGYLEALKEALDELS